MIMYVNYIMPQTFFFCITSAVHFRAPRCLGADVLRLWEFGVTLEPPRLVAGIPGHDLGLI